MIRSLTIATAAILAIGIAPAIQASETHHDYDHDSDSYSSYHHDSHDSDSHHDYHRPVKKVVEVSHKSSRSRHYVPKKKVVYTPHHTVVRPHSSTYSYPYGYGYGSSYYGNGYSSGYYNNGYYSNGYYSNGYYR
jgi:hypothetical protein